MTGRSYTHNFFKVQHIIIQAKRSRKSIKNSELPMKKYSVSLRPLTVENNSQTDLRTSHPQLSGKVCQYREEDSKNKTFVIKRVYYR